MQSNNLAVDDGIALNVIGAFRVRHSVALGLTHREDFSSHRIINRSGRFRNLNSSLRYEPERKAVVGDMKTCAGVALEIPRFGAKRGREQACDSIVRIVVIADVRQLRTPIPLDRREYAVVLLAEQRPECVD